MACLNMSSIQSITFRTPLHSPRQTFFAGYNAQVLLILKSGQAKSEDVTLWDGTSPAIVHSVPSMFYIIADVSSLMHINFSRFAWERFSDMFLHQIMIHDVVTVVFVSLPQGLVLVILSLMSEYFIQL